MSHEMEIVNKGVEQSRGGSVAPVSSPVPCPREPIAIRPATLDDLPFIDGLQKKQTKQVGWFPTKTIEGKIGRGMCSWLRRGTKSEGSARRSEECGCRPLPPRPLTSDLSSVPVGYLIGNDQYFKRDDVGIIYQINIAEGKQRGLIGATLLKAQFERSCVWVQVVLLLVSQDIAANRFWEACGFVPLAFRAGSEKKQRIHIFWSKRIRARRYDDAVVVSVGDQGRSDDGGSAGLPDPAGHALERRQADRAAERYAWMRASVEAVGRCRRGTGDGEEDQAGIAAIKKRQPLCGGLMLQSPESSDERRSKSRSGRRRRRSRTIRSLWRRRGSCAIGGWSMPTRILKR